MFRYGAPEHQTLIITHFNYSYPNNTNMNCFNCARFFIFNAFNVFLFHYLWKACWAVGPQLLPLLFPIKLISSNKRTHYNVTASAEPWCCRGAQSHYSAISHGEPDITGKQQEVSLLTVSRYPCWQPCQGHKTAKRKKLPLIFTGMEAWGIS